MGPIFRSIIRSFADTKTKRLAEGLSPGQGKTDGDENELTLVLGCRDFEGQSSGTSSVGKLVGYITCPLGQLIALCSSVEWVIDSGGQDWQVAHTLNDRLSRDGCERRQAGAAGPT